MYQIYPELNEVIYYTILLCTLMVFNHAHTINDMHNQRGCCSMRICMSHGNIGHDLNEYS